MDLSFCIIVKNEASALPRCLDSVKSVVDEIIVVDTGSSDRTIEIARSYGARVYSFEWCNDFSAARNASLQYAQGDWVLVLDADETLVPDSIPALKQALRSPQYLVLNLIRQEIGATQSPYSMVSRLFRRHPALYFTRPYHAMVDDSVEALLRQEPQWEIGCLPDVAILHTGYQPDVIAAQDKFGKARITMEGFLQNHPDDPYVCSKLGALYGQMGDPTKGLALLQRGWQALTAQDDDNPTLLYELNYHLGSTYRELGDIQQAQQHYETAVQAAILPRLKLGAINNLGSLLQEQGNLPAAEALHQAALRIDPEFAIGYYNLGMTLKAMGQFEAAIAHYQQAIKLQPDYAEAYQNLGVVWLKTGQVRDSLAAFRQAIALHEQAGSPEAERLRQGLTEMGLLSQ
jgi:tetratricopeptide (TPR) repeat protein